MLVAVIALVFAMTGTGIAAKSLITGKQIKDGSITSKDLAKGAVTAKNLAKGAVTGASIATDAVKSSAIAPDAVTAKAIAASAVTPKAIAADAVTAKAIAPQGVWERMAPTPTVCANGIIVYTGACPVIPAIWATARGSFTGNPPVPFSKFMAISGNPAKVGTQPIDVAQLAASTSAVAHSVQAQVIGPWPSRASSIKVTLLINDVGVSVDTSWDCTLTPAQTACSLGLGRTMDLPAHARLAWSAQVITQPVVPPAIPTQVEDFDLSAAVS